MDAQSTSPGQTPIYVVAAHPNWQDSRANRQLRDAAKTHGHVEVCDLFGRYPDYAIDVPREQAALQAAQLIVLLHPIQWYSMPALLKLWLDDVLAFGWAYGGGNALCGKDLWLVATTGGAESAYHPSGYNRYFFEAFMPPYEQTAHLCGMRFLPPLVLHGAHAVSQADLGAHVDVFRQRLQSYPDWPELDEIEACVVRAVPASDRPAEEQRG